MEGKNLKAQIEDAARHALKNREELLLSTLRLLLAAIHSREIEKRAKTGSPELDDEEVMVAIRSEAKKRKDAIAEFTRGGRAESAKKEAAELVILENYLPQELSDGEIEEMVREAIAETGASSENDFGRAMGAAMKKIAGRASGDRVQDMVRKALSRLRHGSGGQA